MVWKCCGLAAFVLTVLLLCADLIAWRQPTGITQRSFDRIRVGMSVEEVEDVIGFPDGQHGPRKQRVVTKPWCLVGSKGLPSESWPNKRDDPEGENLTRGKVKYWSGYGIYLAVAFDEWGLVLGCELVTEDPPDSWPR